MTGEVDSQSILDNKNNTKLFLINKMHEGSQNNNDSRAEPKKATLKTEVPLNPSNSVSSPLKMATLITTNGINGSQNTSSNGAATVQTISVTNGKEEQMHLVEARLCFIDQAAVLPSFNGSKRDKSTSTIITENKIAQEIEECRMREEELKLQRFELFGQNEARESVSSDDVFSEETEILPVVAKGNFVESIPVNMERLRLSSPMPSLMQVSEIAGLAAQSESTKPEVPKYSSVDEDYTSSRIKVRPLHDDSGDDDKPMYMVYTESAVEREIRMTREREEDLRREKSQRELGLKGSSQEDRSVVIMKDVSILKDSKQVPALNLEGSVSDSSSIEQSAPTPRLEVFQSTLDVPALRNPMPEAPALKIPLMEAPVQNGHVSLIEKRSGSSLTLSMSKNKAASRVTEQNMASARLQEEVNEMIQKELALKESGSIATTSQDRIDDKVINIRQYKVERSLSAAVPQPTPPTPPLLSTPPKLKEATITSNGSQYAPMARQVSLGGQSNGTPRPNLYRTTSTKGLMERFINSKGRMSAMPVFVPKVTKPAPLEVTAKAAPQEVTNKPASLEVITNNKPEAPSLANGSSAQHNQELNTKEEDTISVNSSEQEVMKPKPEIITYRRNYSMVENKILSELRDMKEREEELRKQRTAGFRRNSKGSLESLLESEDSGENNRLSDSPTGFDGIFSFAKDYDSDNSLEYQTYLQGTTRKGNYWINQWEERMQQNES